MPLSEREYMRKKPRTSSVQASFPARFTEWATRPAQPGRRPGARGKPASWEKRHRPRKREFSEQGQATFRPRRHLGIAFAVAIVSAGIVGAFVVVAVRELL